MKTILFVLSIACAVTLQAQQLKMSFIPAGDIENDVSDVHQYGNKFFTDEIKWSNVQFALLANLKKVTYAVELSQYDEQLKELKKLSIDNGKKDLGPFRPEIHYGKDAIYVMYYKFMEDEVIKMFVTKVRPDDLSIIATQEVMEYDQKNRALWGTIKTIDDTQSIYEVSEDETQTWLVHATPSLIMTTVIAPDLKIIQKTESVPVKLPRITVTSAYIGNDGNKTLVYKYKDEQVKDFEARGIFFQPANENGSFQNLKFQDGVIPGNMSLMFSKVNSKLFLGGDYWGVKYDQGSQGVLLAVVDIKAASVSTPVIYPYPAELKQRVLDLDFARKRDGGIVLWDFDMKYAMNEMENGTIVLSTDMLVIAGFEKSTTHYRGPVIHVFAKPGGTASMTLIPKKQLRSSYTGFSNYIFKDKLITLYVDVPKFLEKDIEDKKLGVASRMGELLPVANIYDADGKLLSKKILMENRKGIKGNIEIRYGSKVNDNKYVFLVTEFKANMVKYYSAVNQLCYLEIF